MRQIKLRYAGECRTCGEDLDVGEEAMYERRMGVYCIGCEPTDTEDIRAHRQEAADRKAEKYEGWAAKRRKAAEAVLDHNREHYRSCHAFNTQPGHIPIRARVIAQDDRAHTSLRKAEEMEEKAERLRRKPAVKGDAERRHAAEREYKRERLEPGMIVDSVFFGPCEIVRVNRKSARVKRAPSGRLSEERSEDLLYLNLPA